MKKTMISPVHIIPLSFLLAISVGTVLLMLPFSTASGEFTDPLTALFTATTSVCVTGLVVVDTYAHWSYFGQLVILILVQIGGLGIITVTSMIMLISKKKFLLSMRMLLGDSLNVDSRRGLLSFLIRIFRGVLFVEAVGMVFFAIRFVPMLGVKKGLWASLFQSVSAFCNAGMDVVGSNSMIDFNGSYLLMGTTMTLIVLGGLGFVVWFDLLDGIRKGFAHRYHPVKIFRRLSEHTKLVLVMTLTLILLGTVCIFATECHNPDTIGRMDLSGKILNSLFQSITFRTAGFASVPQEKLTESTCLIGNLLMFIGGSPVGTAGGVKTVTAFLFFMNAYSYINRKKENVIFSRRVPDENMEKAAAIIFFSLIAIFVMTLLLMSRGGIAMTDALYEVVSALGTVGLSRGLTPSLDSWGRFYIIISMFLGRIGPISMAIFFAQNNDSENALQHANGKFYVG